MIKELKEVVAEFERLEGMISQKEARIKRLEAKGQSLESKEIRALNKRIYMLEKLAETSDFDFCTQCNGEGGFSWQTEFDAGGEECPKCLGCGLQEKE